MLFAQITDAIATGGVSSAVVVIALAAFRMIEKTVAKRNGKNGSVPSICPHAEEHQGILAARDSDGCLLVYAPRGELREIVKKLDESASTLRTILDEQRDFYREYKP